MKTKTLTMIAATAMVMSASCVEYKNAAEAYAAKDYNALVTLFLYDSYGSLLKASDADAFVDACLATTNRVLLAYAVFKGNLIMTPVEASEKVLLKNANPLFAAYVLCRGAFENGVKMTTNSTYDALAVKIAKTVVSNAPNKSNAYGYWIGYGFEEALVRGDLDTFSQYYATAKAKGANACKTMFLSYWRLIGDANPNYVNFVAQQLAEPNVFDNAALEEYIKAITFVSLYNIAIKIPYCERVLKLDNGQKVTASLSNNIKYLIYAPIEYREKAVGIFINSNEFLTAAILFNTCKWADAKIAKSKKFTEENFNRFADDKAVLISAAIYLNDNDKLIDVLLAGFGSDLSAETLNTVIAKINTFDSVYRANDVKKVLKDINKKYTLKLYDDRDTWEPILSKVRALLELY